MAIGDPLAPQFVRLHEFHLFHSTWVKQLVFNLSSKKEICDSISRSREGNTGIILSSASASSPDIPTVLIFKSLSVEGTSTFHAKETCPPALMSSFSCLIPSNKEHKHLYPLALT